jgi:cobalt/nickel transport protein
MFRNAFFTVLICTATAAQAHYGMIIPSENMVTGNDGRAIDLTLSFSHPFEEAGMEMVPPASFTVTHDGTVTDLTGTLTPETIMGADGYTTSYTLPGPGSHVFALEPAPYWEPTEDAFILHYTKTYVSAFGDDAGWDAELGLKTEIVPLSKPFALWAGNVFQGIVKRDGVALPFAEVEVEHYNTSQIAAPDDLMITQTIKADTNGVFTYAAPFAGWWGFAALTEADYTLSFDGEEKGVELGAVIWVHFEDIP